mgnify:FL=1
MSLLFLFISFSVYKVGTYNFATAIVLSNLYGGSGSTPSGQLAALNRKQQVPLHIR